MICQNCGKAVAPYRDRYCNHCGADLPVRHSASQPVDGETKYAPPDEGPIRVRTYAAATPAETAAQFQLDATEAARRGFRPSSQAWQGTSLTVTYQRDGPVGARSASAPDIASLIVILGGVMVLIGSFLPWVTATSGLFSVSKNGMDDGGDGVLTFIAGIVMVVSGLIASRSDVGGVVAILGAIGAGAVGILDVGNVTQRIKGLDTNVSGAVGFGLWLVVAGAIIGGVAAIATVKGSRRLGPAQ